MIARGTFGFSSHPDPWLSGVLKRPALRLVRAGEDDADWRRRISGETFFAAAKVDCRDVAAVAVLQQAGFWVVDTALTFAADRIQADLPSNIRFARAEDEAAIVRIAATRMTTSRFHLDPEIPDAQASAIKAAWVANYFRGQRADGMVVAVEDDAVVGFLLLLWAGDQLVIDLIAVDGHVARRGFARSMIAYAAAHGTGDMRRAASYRVGTQAANIGAVRLYESLGFRLVASEFVLHHHGRGVPRISGSDRGMAT